MNIFAQHYRFFFINFIVIFSFTTAFAQEFRPIGTNVQRAFSNAERDRLFEQALAVFSEVRIPSAYRDRITSVEPQRCPTMLLMDVKRNLDNFDPDQQIILRQLLARPILPLSFVSPSGIFRIHYTTTGTHAVPAADLDGNSIPDFIDETALAFDESFALEVNDLGYRAAPSDDGIDGPEYDIYIQELGRQAYGFTVGEVQIPGTPQNDFTSYIQIDNDFDNGHASTGVDGARVAAAHEYFHAIQFGYRLFATTEEPFYYEMCSTWMEDVAYDNINDYLAYLPYFFRHTEIPFNSFDIRSYGQAVWNHFLVKEFDDIDLIRRSWEIMQEGPLAIAAIDQSLLEKGSRLKEAMAEFAIWNYFTGPNRADAARYYEEGANYPNIQLAGNFLFDSDTTIVDSSLSLTAQYYKFTTTIAGEYAISGEVDNPSNWLFNAIVGLGASATAYTFNLANGQNLGFLPEFTEIVVVPVNLLVLDGADLPQLNSRRSRFQFSLIRGAVDGGENLGITNIFPNPFIIGEHSRVIFEFNPANTSNLEARILDSNGRVVKTVKFRDGDPSLSQSFFAWDAAGDIGSSLASGIYLFQLQQDDFIAMKKFAVIRK